jgi:hypothetical protein
MERLTGKQAQNMMEAVASVYDKSEESQDEVSSEGETVNEAGGPALPGEPGRPGTPKAPGGRPHLPGEKPTPKPKGNPGLRLAGVDLFDIVKGHLIDEGLTEEEALKKMLTLTDEERSEIIEGSCGSKKDKKKKGGYGK